MMNLKAQALVKDADALTALAIGAGLALAPASAFERVVDNPTIFGPLLVLVFGGRYGLRMVGAHGSAKAMVAHGVGESLAVAPGVELTDADLDEIESAG